MPLSPAASYRILYHHRTQGRGGEGHHIVSIVAELRKLGHQVDILSPAGVDPLALTEDAPVDKVTQKPDSQHPANSRALQRLWSLISRRAPLWVFELMEIAYNLPAAWRLRKQLKKHRYDFIYERYAFYLVAGGWLAKRHQIPFLLEANEVVGIADRARPQQFTGLSKAFERYLFRRTTVLLPVSSYLSELARNHAPTTLPMVVIPNAIDPAALADQTIADIAPALKDKTVIGFAGWFDNWDRLDLLVEVFTRLAATHPQLHLLLVGDGPGLNRVREIIGQRNLGERVTLTGSLPRSQVFQYLRLLDIALLPHSNKFGSPIILFEFFGLKIPVVAPRLPPLEDVITSAENGLLFTPLDITDCVRQVTRLLDDPPLRQQISDRAHQRLLEQHTWQKNSERIIEIFQTR